MTVVLVDTGIGNFGSIVNAIKRLGGEPVLGRDSETLAAATHIILPGVGSFDAGMRTLEKKGLLGILTSRVMEARVPVLGICLGMQMLGMASEEGELPGLGWLPGRTRRFEPPAGSAEFRIPHIGWNGIRACRSTPLLSAIDGAARFYFVHSYHYVEGAEEDTVATTDYCYPFAAVVQRRNIVGTQFHPERSGPDGLRFLRNFLDMRDND